MFILFKIYISPIPSVALLYPASVSGEENVTFSLMPSRENFEVVQYINGTYRWSSIWTYDISLDYVGNILV